MLATQHCCSMNYVYLFAVMFVCVCCAVYIVFAFIVVTFVVYLLFIFFLSRRVVVARAATLRDC